MTYEHMIRAELDQAEMHLPKGMLDELGEKGAVTSSAVTPSSCASCPPDTSRF